MWRDGVYVYEEFGSLNIASIPDQIPMMKTDMLKLLEFMVSFIFINILSRDLF